MNMRCFEALACKSLLFLEEENLEIKNFLKDKVHCILYNDKNLEELINYYLTHEDERRRIADEGHKKVKQILQEDALMRVEKLIGKWLPVINSEAGGKKKDDKPNEPNEKFKIIAHNIISWTNFPSELPSIADDVLAHLEDAKDSKMDAKILNFKGVTLALKGIYWNSREFLIKSALALRKSCEKDVTWAIPHFNLGKVLFILGDTDNAVQCFKNTVTLTKTLGSESVKELDIFLTQAYDFFRVELERLYWTYPDNEELRFNIAKLTLASSLEYLGDIFRRDKKASVNFYEASIIIKPENPHIRYKFAKALLESGEVKRAVDEFEAAYAHSPLHSIGYGYVKYFIKALSIARLLNRLREIKSELKLITKASPQLGENLKENA
jgi:tetratricopeptide (TPR) repeat protein